MCPFLLVTPQFSVVLSAWMVLSSLAAQSHAYLYRIMFPLKSCWLWLSKWFLSSTCPCRLFSQGFILFVIPWLLSASFCIGRQENGRFSTFCFFSGFSSKEGVICCPLGSPPRWAACARLDLALLPITLSQELGQDLLLPPFNGAERFSLSLLRTITCGLRRRKELQGWKALMVVRHLKTISDVAQQGGCTSGAQQPFSGFPCSGRGLGCPFQSGRSESVGKLRS